MRGRGSFPEPIAERLDARRSPYGGLDARQHCVDDEKLPVISEGSFFVVPLPHNETCGLDGRFFLACLFEYMF